MNRDDIIRMTNEAGGGRLSDRQFQLHGLDTITQFAALVAAAEREACAKLCEEWYEYYGYDHIFAAKIRARK